MSNKKTSNIYGQVYDFPKEEISSLEQIRPGDHLACEHSKLYWHHWIVVNIIENQCLVIIHYSNGVKDGSNDLSYFGSLARVREDVILFDPNRFHRIVYNEETYSPEEVIQRARSKLGEKKYRPLANNCEHFATECKIGERNSQQALHVKESLLGQLTMSLSDLAIFVTTELAPGEFLTFESLSNLGNAAVGSLTRTGVLACCGIELGLFFKDIFRSHGKMKNKEISYEEFKEASLKRAIVAISTMGLSVCATVLALWLFPVGIPALLAVLFAGIVGNKLGRVIGAFLSELWITIKNKLGFKSKQA